ncbi:FK506-binding protein 5 [Venturia canescens]|uniref:FK506-binding protein 5 n=1 Tax=Venturia canescens TaxID=32260 RepID=UPI001C9D1BCB|nr:FK506-binding protein 5-like [Venturia canescens]
MRGTKLFLGLASILLLSMRPCNGLCTLKNGTMARCTDLEDGRYIAIYDLKILKASVSEKYLRPDIFHKFVGLRNLDLSSGDIEQIDSQAFRELLDLRSLDLSYNNITAVPSKLFDNLTKLRLLNLQNNSLIEIPDAVMSAKGLEILDVSNNKINDIPSKLFDNLTKLRHLNLRSNAFVDIPTAVTSAKSLKSLDLSGNPLNCNCATLKDRDLLLARKVFIPKTVLCANPANLKGRPLLNIEAEVICMFEEQDREMQMDQPEGSGEASQPVDRSDNPITEEIDEEKEVSQEVPAVHLTAEEIETPAPERADETEKSTSSSAFSPSSSSSGSPVTNSLEEAAATSDELFFSEDKDRLASSSTMASTTASDEIDEKSEEPEKKIVPRVGEGEKGEARAAEGSGEEDELHEGSGIEGSGTGVPHIIWDVPDDEVPQETSSPEPEKTTDTGLLDMLWGVLWSTPAVPEDEKKKDLNPEDEEFINVSSEATPLVTEKVAVDERIIVPEVVTKNEGAPQAGAVEVNHIADESKSGRVKAQDETDAEATDASATRQPKKGMGSYVVLAALLAVLGVLIGFAAYKGDFCRKKRKRSDPESGTELKDMRKSLLDAANTNQPKIASNGNLENVPLVSTPPPDDSKPAREERISDSPDVSRTRYSGMAPDVVDPIKPPRKSYAPHDETEGAMPNGKSQQDLAKFSVPVAEANEPVCLRNKSGNEPVINGNRHDSVSSLGTESRDSPSVRTGPRISSPTNGSYGTQQALARPPLSPGAQRVKITLQENPDSVPRTPILITRTKTGENLVKTP